MPVGAPEGSLGPRPLSEDRSNLGADVRQCSKADPLETVMLGSVEGDVPGRFLAVEHELASAYPCRRVVETADIPPDLSRKSRLQKRFATASSVRVIRLGFRSSAEYWYSGGRSRELAHPVLTGTPCKRLSVPHH